MSTHSDSRSCSQVCDDCINCCCNCLNICLEKLKPKQKDGKYPNIEYKPPEATQKTFEVPEILQTPIPGRTFEFAQSSTPSDVAIHPSIVITEQPKRMSRRRSRTPESDRSHLMVPEGLKSHQTTRGSFRRFSPERQPVLRRSMKRHKKDTELAMKRSIEIGEALALPPHLTLMQQTLRQDGGDSQRLGAESGGTTTPKLQFAVFYDLQQRMLVIDLISASNLIIPERKGLCSSIVSIHLYPNTEEIHSSQVVFNSSDPVYNESFTFMNFSSLKEVQEQTLVFKVFHHSVFTRNELIGSVVLPLKNADLFATPIVMEIVRDDAMDDQTHSTGDILLSLCYSTDGTLGGVILKATNLHKPAWGLTDPYVKVYLLHHGNRVSKWKSNTKYNTLIPVFNESFKFDISTMDIKDLSLDVFVVDYDRFKHNEIIGFVRIRANSTSQSAKNHWTEMLSAPNQQVSHWHQLQPPAELSKM